MAPMCVNNEIRFLLMRLQSGFIGPFRADSRCSGGFDKVKVSYLPMFETPNLPCRAAYRRCHSG